MKNYKKLVLLFSFLYLSTFGVVLGAGSYFNINQGGTNTQTTPTAGAVTYGNGSSYAFTSVGTSGQVLTSAGAGTPTWATPTTGTVTSVSVITANGLAGSSSGGATPALTLSTTITGILKGNGTAISAASPGSDYEVPLTFSTGLTRTVNTVTVNTSQNISTLSNLTTNGFVKTSGGTGALSIDTNTYLTTAVTSVAASGGSTGLTFSGSPITTTGTLTLGGTLGIANGGTGQATANAAFNALSPMTTGGDLIYGGASGVGTRLANGSSGQVLTSAGGTSAPTWTSITSGVSSVSNSDGTLTISPTTGAVTASLALGHANTWTGQQTFNTSAPIIGTGDAQSLTFLNSSTKAINTDPALWYDNTNKTVFVNWPGTATSPNGQTFLEVFNNADVTMNADNLTSGVTSPTMSVSNYRLGGGYSYLQPNINNIGDTVGAFTFYGVTGTTPFTAGTNAFSVFGSINTTITGSTVGNAQGTMNFMTKANAGSNATRMALSSSNLTMSVPITYASALGAITHLLGPIDQVFLISNQLTSGATGTGNDITIKTPDATSSGLAGSLNLTTGISSGNFDGGYINLTANVSTGSNGRGGVIKLTSNGRISAGDNTSLSLVANLGDVVLKTSGTNTTVIGNVNISTHTASSANTGVAGGAINNTTGTGGAGSSSTIGAGGAGGAYLITMGGGGSAAGGNSGINAGDAGAYSVVGGAGGNATAAGTHTGGAGSSLTLTSGAGGNASGASGTRTGGNSGSITFQTAAAGTGASANGTVGSILFQINGATTVGQFTAGTFSLTGDLKLTTAGNGIYIKEGTNATMGTCVLVLGTCTVSTTKVTANSRIFTEEEALGTVTVPTTTGITARTPATSFVITSANATDTSTVSWVILEPS